MFTPAVEMADPFALNDEAQTAEETDGPQPIVSPAGGAIAEMMGPQPIIDIGAVVASEEPPRKRLRSWPGPRQNVALSMLPRESTHLQVIFIDTTIVPIWPQYYLGNEVAEETYVKLYDREGWFASVIHGVRQKFAGHTRRSHAEAVMTEKKLADAVFDALTLEVTEKICRARSQHKSATDTPFPELIEVLFGTSTLLVNTKYAGKAHIAKCTGEFEHWIFNYLVPLAECVFERGPQPTPSDDVEKRTAPYKFLGGQKNKGVRG